MQGQNILVTGAGGYIGSGLVKALAAGQPVLLVLLDSSEQNLFEIRRTLAADFPGVRNRAVLGSVEDAGLLDELFASFRPHTIFHAAAHKHVELLEWNPFAGLRNNVLGTYTLAQAALRYRSHALLLISTDKSVRPHSVMGVSKRLAEMVVMSLSSKCCRMNAIRLGNVMGSSGSVVPILLEQAAQGKSITITHPDATRYFLSLDESVAAILAARTSPVSGKIFLPHFRPPLRIADLAQSLLEPNNQLAIEYIGLRPGEKLSEDLTGPGETTDASFDSPLRVLNTPRLSPDNCEELVEQLAECVASRNQGALLELLTSIVPEYQPSRVMIENARFPARV
jgi:FlaA1/EpsC-like NDP-sugar epimerase